MIDGNIQPGVAKVLRACLELVAEVVAPTILFQAPSIDFYREGIRFEDTLITRVVG